MVTCINCGTKNKEDAKYCSSCGVSMLKKEPNFTKERDKCFGEEEKDPLGWLSFGFFVLVLGIVFVGSMTIMS